MNNVKICGVWLAIAAAVAPGSTVAREAMHEEDLQAAVRGNAEFALDLYARLRQSEGNLFLSPASLSAALAMTYAGARGRTETQMGRVLHFDLPQNRLHPAFASLGDPGSTGRTAQDYELNMANALWGQEGYEFVDAYLELVNLHYGAGFHELDFRGAGGRARRTINTWIADRTEQRIQDLLRPGDLGPASELVLTNAIYFKGRWAARFDDADTRDAPFRTPGGDEVSVPFMGQTGRFAFGKDEDLEILELPFAGERLSMLLLLPQTAEGLGRLEDSLSLENFARWLELLHEQPVQVRVPRFGIETRFDLAETLAAMGMADAFGAGADFSGISGRRDLFLSGVIHQARVEVSEEGTEAAAGTAVVLKKGVRPARFVADHPFLFLIRDDSNGSILFMGRVVNPKP